MVSQAGGVPLVETARKAGLDQAIPAALAPWRKTFSTAESTASRSSKSYPERSNSTSPDLC